MRQESHAAKTMTDRWALVVATALGAGFVPYAPGTAGSLMSVGLWLALYKWLPGGLAIPVRLTWLVILLFIGIWASSRSESWFGKKDPAQTVIDEVLGQQIAYLGLTTLDWRAVALGFALFRLFDVWKPYPIRKLENLQGGTGIMMDDVFAGVYACGGLFVIGKMLHWM